MGRTNIDDLWDYRDPEASEDRFRALLPGKDEDADPGWHAELLSQLARALCLQRRHDEAHEALDRAEPLLSRAGERATIRVYLERGRIHNEREQTETAYELFREAWERADACGETLLAADALHMLAYVSRGEANLHWHEIALAFCRSHDAPRFHRWQVTLYANMADEFERQGRFEEGRRAVEHGLAVAEDLGLEQAAGAARISLARLHRLDGDLAEAWRIMESVFDPEDPRGWAHEEYAECLHARGETQAARPHFRRAFELLSNDPWYPPSERRRLARLERLATEPSRQPPPS